MANYILKSKFHHIDCTELTYNAVVRVHKGIAEAPNEIVRNVLMCRGYEDITDTVKKAKKKKELETKE